MTETRVRQPLLQGKALERTVRRMAFEIAEQAGPGARLIFIGVEGSGAHLAGDLARGIRSAFGLEVPVHVWFRNGTGLEGLDTSGAQVVLVDDVIFSGSTLFRMLQGAAALQAADRIRIAVLVDRGHRRFPLHADVVGLVSPTKLDEHIDVAYRADEAFVTLVK